MQALNQKFKIKEPFFVKRLLVVGIPGILRWVWGSVVSDVTNLDSMMCFLPHYRNDDFLMI